MVPHNAHAPRLLRGRAHLAGPALHRTAQRIHAMDPQCHTRAPPLQPFHQLSTAFVQPKRPPPPLPEYTAQATSAPYWQAAAPIPVHTAYPTTAPPTATTSVTDPWPAPYQSSHYQQSPQPQPRQHLSRRPDTADATATVHSTTNTAVTTTTTSIQCILPPGQQPYWPNDDPWNNYGRGWDNPDQPEEDFFCH